MPSPTILAVSALVAMLPAALLPYRRGAVRDAIFWAALGAAMAGSLLWVYIQFAAGWKTGLSASLWLTIATSLILFTVLSITTRELWRLTPLLLPYLILLGLVATIWQAEPARPIVGGAPAIWLQLHIVLSVITYSLLTIAAIAGFAVLLQEKKLKAKRPTTLTRLLPSVADSGQIEIRLLIACEIVLGVGLLTGMAVQHFETGRLLTLEHKPVFALLTFAVIGALLIAHYRSGIRGRRAARYVLLAYLLLTLAYPGVKFVTDILIP